MKNKDMENTKTIANNGGINYKNGFPLNANPNILGKSTSGKSFTVTERKAYTGKSCNAK